jgi:hypothetical protein
LNHCVYFLYQQGTNIPSSGDNNISGHSGVEKNRMTAGELMSRTMKDGKLGSGVGLLKEFRKNLMGILREFHENFMRIS